MQPFFRLVSSITFLAAVFLPACSASGTSSSADSRDAASVTLEVDGGSDAASSFADASKKDGSASQPAAGPVTVLNLSYVNDGTRLSTEVTFVLRNSANERIEKIRSVKLLFEGTEVAAWSDLSLCPEWLVSPRRTSAVLTMSVSTYDTDDSNTTALVTCSIFASSSTRGKRPRATRSAIGNGAVTLVVNGVLSDATPFVAQTEAPAP